MRLLAAQCTRLKGTCCPPPLFLNTAELLQCWRLAAAPAASRTKCGCRAHSLEGCAVPVPAAGRFVQPPLALFTAQMLCGNREPHPPWAARTTGHSCCCLAILPPPAQGGAQSVCLPVRAAGPSGTAGAQGGSCKILGAVQTRRALGAEVNAAAALLLSTGACMPTTPVCCHRAWHSNGELIPLFHVSLQFLLPQACAKDLRPFTWSLLPSFGTWFASGKLIATKG